MFRDDVFARGFKIFGPTPVRGRPGVFSVCFVPQTIMAIRGPGEEPDIVRLWDALVIVDSANEGTVLEHRKLDPQVAELDPTDFEVKALQLVRGMKQAA
ncbi:unnamed protein product [Gemmata massiliana]|uniref:Uncharacterized protein n=1 Tax=Gemmata massiliana TaxID=1210884 RepID=A0A6P2CYS2_9BACT|nr:hypothetical protein [Gemmata massiliana]VTR94121.1 unnamed protein product [Gemmata massiliana]